MHTLNFQERIKGDHHIFTRDDVLEIVNIQPLNSGKAKAYQVKQIRNIILKYKLNRGDWVMHQYEVIIYWSAEDKSYIVEVPELAGCMADGKTYDEALKNAQIIMDEWIETSQTLGRPIPEPKGKLVYA